MTTNHVSLTDISAWVEPTKMGPAFTALDVNLESQISGDVLAALDSTFDETLWVDSTSTPLMVRRVMAMRYTAWVYYRTIGDQNGDDGGNSYADMLLRKSDELLAGIISGVIDLIDVAVGVNLGTSQPEYYPTDESSALRPTYCDPSLGGPYFSMGRVF